MIEEMKVLIDTYMQNQLWRVAFIAAAAVLIALICRIVLVPLFSRLSRRTASDFDEQLLKLIWPAVYRTIVLQGVHIATIDFLSVGKLENTVLAITATMMVLIWGRVFNAGSAVVFSKLSSNAERFSWIQPQTLPLIQFVFKVVLFSVMSYMMMAAWHIDLTSWLASAGVAGLALGFAAKDTLANFVAGVFILADAPYRVGEYIIIDGTTRGMVTEIGMRSTRLLTRDNVEVTVPNGVIGNAKIVNESSGPSPRMRVRVNVGVAYGSDIDQVRELLLECTKDLDLTTTAAAPAVRFTAMGESSLDFQVLVWLKKPEFRGRVINELNTRIYKALNKAAIEIPFPQRDLHVKSWPAGSDQALQANAPAPENDR